MCRFFLPSGTDAFVLVWWYLTTAHVLFKTLSLRPNSSNFDFHIVRAGTHGVFPSAKKQQQQTKTDRRQPGAIL